MVVGVGIDIVAIARIESAMRHSQFLQRILTEEEEAYGTSSATVAGRWAAKEAVMKAVGVHFSPIEIAILNDPLGGPHVHIRNPHFDSGRLRVYVSITHERTHAAAVAIVERIQIHRPAI